MKKTQIQDFHCHLIVPKPRPDRTPWLAIAQMLLACIGFGLLVFFAVSPVFGQIVLGIGIVLVIFVMIMIDREIFKEKWRRHPF